MRRNSDHEARRRHSKGRGPPNSTKKDVSRGKATETGLNNDEHLLLDVRGESNPDVAEHVDPRYILAVDTAADEEEPDARVARCEYNGTQGELDAGSFHEIEATGYVQNPLGGTHL